MVTCQCGGARALRRRRTVSSTAIVRQCFDCGRIDPVALREVRDLTRAEIERLPWAVRKRKLQPTSRKRAQRAHMQSKEMRELRKRVFARDGGIWTICGDKATDLYHLRTDSYGRETEADVVASCRDCNLAEREQRIARHVLGPA